MTLQACLFTSQNCYLEKILWKIPARIDSEPKAAIVILYKVNYSFRKITDILESTQTPAISLFQGLISQATLSSSDGLFLQQNFGTVESLISWKSRDSISTVESLCSFGLLNRTEWHNTVKIESCDGQNIRVSTVRDF